MKIKTYIFTFIASITLLTACGSSDVATGGEGNSSEKKVDKEEAAQSNEKRFDASSNSSKVLGMKVALGEIKITEDKLSVGVNIENTTDKPLSFYPDQGKSVVGDMQLDANMFMTTGSIGGDVQGGVKQDGVIEFLVPDGKQLDVQNISEIKLLFGDIMTDDFMNTQPVEFTVKVN